MSRFPKSRKFARLGVMLLLPLLGCEKPPAGETTPPTETGPAPVEAEAELPAAQEVLAKSIEAVGGQAAIEAIASSYTEAKTEIAAQNISVATKIWSKGDNFYVESDMPGMGLTQMWKKGDEIWSKDPINGMRKLEGKEADQARWSTDPILAANWAKYFDEAKTVGKTKVGDRDVIEVELRKGETAVTLMFDASTFMPVGQSFTQETPMGAMPIKVTLEDFRDVAGVKTPFRSVTDMSVMSAVQTTEKYEVNVEVDDAKFVPPQS